MSLAKSLAGGFRRHALLVHLASLLVASASLLAIIWWLPVSRALIEIRGLLEHAGAWGPLALLVLYVIANLALIPGALVMLVAGAVLSPMLALVTMSLGTALAAAAGFVIARHVAHGPIERIAARSRRLDALRESIADGGFGMLVLLRLTPVVPYGISNYVFGLTPVRLGTFVLASWIAMIPTTLLYTLLGYTGGESIVALQSGLDLPGDGPLEMLLIALGFALRWVGVLYVVRRTRLRLARTRPADGLREPPIITASGFPLGPLLSSAGAGALLMGALAAYAARDLLVSLPGPEAVVMREAYEDAVGGPSFDHALFDQVLQGCVDDEGWVDYVALVEDSSLLDRYIASIAEAPFDSLARDEKLALLVNAYNAFTLRLVVDHWPLGSILEIPYDRRWDGRKWNVGGHRWTLYQIEQEQCRGSFVEPRVHFVLTRAAVGCPPLRDRAYRGAELDSELEERTRWVHERRRWLQLSGDDLPPGMDLEVGLTRIYAWYRGDFEQVADRLLTYVARYSPRLERALESGESVKIHWLPFDWRLNSIEARRHEGDDQL